MERQKTHNPGDNQFLVLPRIMQSLRLVYPLLLDCFCGEEREELSPNEAVCRASDNTARAGQEEW